MVVAKCCTRAVEEVAEKPLTTAKWIGGMLVVLLGVYGLGWFFASSMGLMFALSGSLLIHVSNQTARDLGLGRIGAISFAMLAGVGHIAIVMTLRSRPILEAFASLVTG